MPKRIVLCFDGTWNTPADEALPPEDQVETNVARFFDSVAPSGADGKPQVKWYNPGVGTDWWDRFVGGTFGLGLDLHIIEGYRTLAEHYEPGDEIFILGFSRGAYTARSLAGMIRNCGVVRHGLLWRTRVPMAYGIYRTRDDGIDSKAARGFRAAFAHDNVRIKFLGVWDTVGALGIPGGVADKLNKAVYEFHDTELSAAVEHAYHAVAIDEFRADYDVCLWDPKQKRDQTLEQRWFAGAHSDVGGGYDKRWLSDLALRWMQDKAAAAGLALTGKVNLTPEHYKAKITDSYGQFMKGEYAKLRKPHLRRVLCTSFGNECLDPSVDQRRGDGTMGYDPKNDGIPPRA